MSIGNVLFTELTTRGFSKVQSEISDLQGLISSGKNDPRASVDQMRAAQLSAFKEQRAAIDHYMGAADQAASRVDLSDQALGDAATIIRRLQELAITAGNDILPEEGMQGIKVEAETLREALLEIANRTDALGQPLFSGYAASPAFTQNADGTVKYLGDDGRPSQRLSETLTLPVGLNGQEAFGSVRSGGERTSVFGIVDKLIESFGAEMYQAKSDYTISGRGQLNLDANRADKSVSFTLAGPNGSVEISASVVSGLRQPMIDAINAQSSTTGVTAVLSEDGKGIVLEADGDFSLTNMARSDDPDGLIGTLQQLEFRGQPGSESVNLKTAAMSQTNMLAKVQAAIGHFAERRAEVGAMGATVDAQKEALSVRSLNIDEGIAGLEDLDIAAAVTKLQTLLLTRDASQQTFVKITQTTLFDYLR